MTSMRKEKKNKCYVWGLDSRNKNIREKVSISYNNGSKTIDWQSYYSNRQCTEY